MDSTTFVNKPWIGNNQFLIDIADSVGYGNQAIPKSESGGFDPIAVYWIPVKAWVYNDNNGTGGIDEAEVEESIARLNEFFAGEVNDNGNAHSHTLIQFYLRCSIGFINNSNYAFNPSDSEIDAMWNNHHETAAMNIHYIQDHNSLAGRGRFPGSNKSFTCMVITNDNRHLDGVLPHEVGHALDVLHPHQGRCSGDNSDCGNCRQEAVSRAKIQPVGCLNFSGDKKCEVNGDGLCDTEADPNINFNVVGTTYQGGGTDNWDDSWNPDVFNIMSYSNPSITERFSTSQIAIMYYWVLGIVPDIIFPSQFDLHIENEFVDVFEPDNHRHSDNEHRIDFGETQRRGLHAERFGIKSNPQYGYCDEDWVHFTVPGATSTRVDIETNPFASAQQVDTELFLFEDDGTTQLANNDDKGAGDIYSKISELELSPGDYWIQVVSNGNTRGEYTLSLDYCEVECCFQPLIGTESVINSTTGPFNVGAVVEGRKEFFGSSVTVTLTGQLVFNDNIQLGFGEPAFPLNNSHLEAEICNNAQITVTGTGRFNLGSSATNRTATVTFTDGTALDLSQFGEINVESGSELIIDSGAELRLNGGTLRVMDGGKVTIKNGGLLRFEENASIELNGNDAQLALSGLTYVGDNAKFGFTYQGTESGYIRLLEEGFWGQRFAAGIDAEIYLKGEDENDRILYMEAGAEIWEWEDTIADGFDYGIPSSNLFKKLTFSNGKIEMEHHARICAIARTYFYSCKLHTVSGQPHGVVPFQTCLFNNCQIAVPIDGVYHYFSKGQLHIRNSEVLRSVSVRAQGYEISNSLVKSSVTSWESTLTNTIINSDLDGTSLSFGSSAMVHDNSLSNLRIIESHLHHINGAAVWKNHGATEIRCSEFTDNNVAIHADKLNEIVLSSWQNTGYNFFDRNNIHFEFWDATGINLADGYNEIYDANYLIAEGRLDKDFYNVSYINSPNCPSNINAINNIWTPYNPAFPPFPKYPDHPNPALFDVSIWEMQLGPGQVTFCEIPFDINQVADITPCGDFDQSGGPKSAENSQKSGTSGFPLVTTATHFTNMPFDEAMYDAASTARSANAETGDDHLAGSKFFELLTADLASVGDSIDSLVTTMKWSALAQYKSVIEGMVTDSLVVRESNEAAFEPVVLEYVNTLMHFTDSVKTQANYKAQFALEIRKIALFRLLGQDDSALQIAVNLSYCDHDSLQQFVLEELIENISYDITAKSEGYLSFLQDSVSFQLDSTIFDIPIESFVDSSGFGTYINGPSSLQFSSCALAFNNKALKPTSHQGMVSVFPNPGSNYIQVNISNTGRDKKTLYYQFELINLSGKQVISTTLSSKAKLLDVSNLASGMYIYRVIDPLSNFQEEGKLVIER